MDCKPRRDLSNKRPTLKSDPLFDTLAKQNELQPQHRRAAETIRLNWPDPAYRDRLKTRCTTVERRSAGRQAPVDLFDIVRRAIVNKSGFRLNTATLGTLRELLNDVERNQI